jgi:hypothetical protein
MRIPSYNEDVEEPWYWAYYGATLFQFSYYLGKYDALHNASDLATAETYAKQVPQPIVDEFLWRRSRNHNVTLALLNLQIKHQKQQHKQPREREHLKQQEEQHQHQHQQHQQQQHNDEDLSRGQLHGRVARRRINKETEANVNTMQPTSRASNDNDSDQTNFFANIYITLDDNALYGLNIEEAEQLRNFTTAQGLDSSVFIYPGADEVGLTMLSKMCVDAAAAAGAITAPLDINVLYRDDSAKQYVPACEGQPMDLTVHQQIAAAGGLFQPLSPSASTLSPSSANSVDSNNNNKNSSGSNSGSNRSSSSSSSSNKNDDEDDNLASTDNTSTLVLLVNNFSTEEQIGADQQPWRPPSDFDVFLPLINQATSRSSPGAGQSLILGFADNRYLNGGDIALVQWLLGFATGNATNRALNITEYAYAGWNTNGNTLGTVIANVILLALYGTSESAMPLDATAQAPAAAVAAASLISGMEDTVALANAHFTLLRLVEDLHYQVSFSIKRITNKNKDKNKNKNKTKNVLSRKNSERGIGSVLLNCEENEGEK